jgi:hypothetical protein
MDNRYVKTYQGYTLHFAPQHSYDSRFLAYLIVTREALKPPIVEYSGVVDVPSFGTSEDAAEAGMVAGMRWVQEKISFGTTTRWLAGRSKV